MGVTYPAHGDRKDEIDVPRNQRRERLLGAVQPIILHQVHVICHHLTNIMDTDVKRLQNIF